MTFEEFEKAKKRVLKARAKECFEKAQEGGAFYNTDMQSTAFLEAQFYMQELDRRHDGWIATRDLILEIIVILLIGGEIWLGYKSSKDQGVLMGSQTTILQKLDTSTSATAMTMKGIVDITRAMSDTTAASGKTLVSLRSTTETMNKGVHDQIALFYDPSIAVVYIGEGNRMQFMNTGKTGITVAELKVDGLVKNLGGAKLIAAGTGYYFELEKEYKSVSADLGKGTGRSVPVEAHLVNELSKHFVLTGALYFVWENDKVVVHGQTISIQAEH